MAISKVTLNMISPTSAPAAASAAASKSKDVEQQIATKEQSLSRLSSDSKLSAAEKEKKRQEIEKEIAELNRKLELMRKEQEEKTTEAAKKQAQEAALKEELRPKTEQEEKEPAESLNISKKEEPKHVDMPIEDVQKLLSTDYALQKDITERSSQKHLENTVNVLKAELSQDQSNGTDTEAKKAEIKEVQAKENFWTQHTIKSQEHAQQETQKTASIPTNAQVVIDQI